MNLMLAFCHFCELHGPSVVFCSYAPSSNDKNFSLETLQRQSPISSTDSTTDRKNCEGCSLTPKSHPNGFAGFVCGNENLENTFSTDAADPVTDGIKYVTCSFPTS